MSNEKWMQLLDVYSSIEDAKPWAHLWQPGIRLVMGDGPETAETARVLIVGEAPGAVENGSGRPFVGPSGKMLEGLLKIAGLAREQTFITNVVKVRPPGNATPTLGEAIAGRAFLRAEYRIIRPRLTVCLGAVSHKIIHPSGVDGTQALSRMEQGALTPMRDGSYCTSIYHPAFGIRFSKMRDRIEEAWNRLGEEIGATPSLATELI